MESEQIPPPRKDLVGNLFGRALVAFGLIGIFSALVSFLVILPSTISATNEIMSQNPYSYFLVNVTSSPVLVYSVLAASAAAVVIAIASLFIGRDGISTGLRKSNRVSFYRYLSIFILIELVLSLISPQISPAYANDPVLKLSLSAQNFIFIASTVSQSIIVQFLPISALVLIFLALRRKLSLSSFLNPDRNAKEAELVIVVFSAAIASFLTSIDIGSSILNFISFFLMNYIYIRFGLLRAIISGFTVSQFNIILQLNQVSYVPIIMYAFLIVWALVGVYSFIMVLARVSQESSAERKKSNESAEGASPGSDQEMQLTSAERSMLKPGNFWIRSSCPSCGNYTFILHDDMSMECKDCHHVIDKNAVGEFNIRLVRTRNVQNRQ